MIARIKKNHSALALLLLHAIDIIMRATGAGKHRFLHSLFRFHSLHPRVAFICCFLRTALKAAWMRCAGYLFLYR